MNIRMQTWFPYRIQIAMNGREWLVRQLEQAGIGFERRGNKILRVDDIDAMQRLLDQQLRTNWCSMLDAFVPIAFPTISSTLGHRLRYTWTLWQSEWASDLLFRDRRELDQIIESAVRHAFIGAYPGRLLRYFGRPVRKDGRPRRDMRAILSRQRSWIWMRAVASAIGSVVTASSSTTRAMSCASRRRSRAPGATSGAPAGRPAAPG